MKVGNLFMALTALGAFLALGSIPRTAFAEDNPNIPPGTTAAQIAAYEAQKAREQSEHPTLALGAKMPAFRLKGVDGKLHSSSEYDSSPVLLIMFISNHCPASQNYEARMKKLVADYGARGVKIIAINPNGPKAVAARELNYSDVDDSYDSMVIRAKYRKFPFPYLYDGDTQSTANQFGPKVTPHIFIFDKQRVLRFEGRIDDAMDEAKATTHDTRAALDALLAGQPVAVAHTPVFGCSTKWDSAIAGKQQEMKDWQALPVTLQPVSLEELKALRTNKTGKMLMINFWATWCGPCQVEYRDLLTTYLWYRSRNFDFVSVSVDAPSSRDEVLRFLREHHSAVRNLQVTTEDVYAVQKAFDPAWESGVPFTIVLSPDNKVIYQHEGELDVLALRRAVLANLPDAGMFAGNAAYWKQ